jgi:hypothetical protein
VLSDGIGVMLGRTSVAAPTRQVGRSMPVGCAQTVFNRPGSGGLMNLAIFRRDVPVLSAAILGIATQNQIAFASLTVCHAPR